ncbi:hypothetical protein KQX54_001627 [Cotesia glomerata]|uniref:Uncharacterized protein n=1 Tax=Cotesia glomerata TaxID=32391 RepID=A0AAV7HQR5_COTGL|nr:hypothetical protein KQX54_001627 [Cotesia glomerata]
MGLIPARNEYTCVRDFVCLVRLWVGAFVRVLVTKFVVTEIKDGNYCRDDYQRGCVWGMSISHGCLWNPNEEASTTVYCIDGRKCQGSMKYNG